MTKEERQKYKELTKALPKILKDKIKKDKFYCTAVETIKPLWLDDLLWDVLKMETNKEAPLSLRTIGAFTVSGSELFKDVYKRQIVSSCNILYY